MLNNEARKDLLDEMFLRIGEQFECKIKNQRNINYLEFTQDQLLDHFCYWILDSKIGRKELNKQWKVNGFKEIQRASLLEDNEIKYFINLLFPVYDVI